MSKERTELGTDLGLLGMAVIWGVNFSVVKYVLEALTPLGLNALRFPLAAGGLALVLRATPGPRRPAPEDVARILALGLVGNVAYQLTFIMGIDATRAGNASLVLSTTPVWTVILSALVGHEHPTPWVSIGVLATLVGMVLVIVGGGDGISLGSATLRGDLLMVVSAVLWSVYTVAGRTPVSRYGALRVTAWSLYVGTPVLVLMGLPSLVRTDLTGLTVGTWGGVLYSGVFSIGLAYLLWYRGVQRLGNNRTAVYSNLVPVAALLTAWVWLGEVPSALQLAGAAVILGGLTVARLAQSPGPSSGQASPTSISSR